MGEIKTETQFGVEFSVDKQLVKQSKMKVVDYEKDKYAAELGMKIAEIKGWERTDAPFSSNYETYRMKLYVFTPEELRKYVEGVILKKL